jgi:hypothetical protein
LQLADYKAKRLPTNRANSQLKNLAHGCDIGHVWGHFIAELCQSSGAK